MLQTKNSSYVIGIVDKENFVGHAYYGPKIEEDDVTYSMRICEAPFTPESNARDRLSFLDCFPQEFPSCGVGDFRESAVTLKNAGGNIACEFLFEGYEIQNGKEKLEGLPATWGNEKDTQTLKLFLRDKVLNIKAVLSYSIFEGIDAIARSVELVNEGEAGK